MGENLDSMCQVLHNQNNGSYESQQIINSKYLCLAPGVRNIKINDKGLFDL